MEKILSVEYAFLITFLLLEIVTVIEFRILEDCNNLVDFRYRIVNSEVCFLNFHIFIN